MGRSNLFVGGIRIGKVGAPEDAFAPDRPLAWLLSCSEVGGPTKFPAPDDRLTRIGRGVLARFRHGQPGYQIAGVNLDNKANDGYDVTYDEEMPAC